MPLSARALTTLATVKEELGISDTSSDAVLERYIEVASDACAAFCGRAFERDDSIVEQVRGYGGVRLLLARPPIVSVASVAYSGVTIDPSEYRIEAETGALYRSGGWAWTAPEGVPGTEGATYTVSYSGGWVTPQQAADSGGTLTRDLPSSIEAAAILVVVTLYRSRGRDPNVAQESLLSARQSFGRDGWAVLSPAVQRLLAPWRRYG